MLEVVQLECSVNAFVAQSIALHSAPLHNHPKFYNERNGTQYKLVSPISSTNARNLRKRGTEYWDTWPQSAQLRPYWFGERSV